MALPYKTLRQPETMEVAGFTLPKYGCLTIAEAQAVADLDAASKAKIEEMTPLQADLYLKQGIITILFRSRLDQDWTMAHTQAERWTVLVGGESVEIQPDMAMLDELFDFFIKEQTRWKTDVEEVNDNPKKPTGRKPTGS